jgi:FKBP-type peptidyl-prolyl cis-trans isomerase 2
LFLRFKMTIQNGSKIKLDYEGRLEDGTVFDSSKKQDQHTPLEFVVGENKVIPGFEKGIMGMEKDQEKEIVLEPKDAYGERNELMIQKIPKEKLPSEIKPEKGMVLALKAPDGRQIPVPVVDVSDTDITLDMNHPLAGKKLIFKVKILEVE